MDTKSSSYEKRARVDLLDLKDQTEGEAHIFFKSKIVRARMFYANPKPVKQLKINQFLKVEPPPDEYLTKLQKQLTSFQSILESGELSIEQTVESEEIDLIVNSLHTSEVTEPIERGVTALMAYHSHNEPESVEDLIEDVVEGALTIFSGLRLNEDAPPLLVADKETFSQPLLPINETRNQIMTIERHAGAKDKYAGIVANELIKDFQVATSYPPEDKEMSDMDDLVTTVRALSSKIVSERERAKSKAEEEFT
jgi:intracellular multiplication protein IcmO